MGGLKKQQSIKINFDTLPDKKKSDENHSFSLSSNNIVQPSEQLEVSRSNKYEAGTSLIIAVLCVDLHIICLMRFDHIIAGKHTVVN